MSTAADPSSRWQGYDVIGDVHGHADKLERLLERLGYLRTTGAGGRPLWAHPDRQAIFVGDLIDRGPHQIRTVELVRTMVDAGSAQMVLGNHEFNAIAFATPDPDAPGQFLRRRSGEYGRHNVHQHRRFLDEVGLDSPLHHDHVAWFSTLPLWLDLGGLRIVHACWDEHSMTTLRPLLGDGNSLSDDLVIAASREDAPEYIAIETILKGPEVELPATHTYLDSDDHPRSRARIRWWDPTARSLRGLAELPAHAKGTDGLPLVPLPETTVDSDLLRPYDGDTPVIFGHYWRTPTSVICTDTTACVDFSAGKGGSLVAYRWTDGTLHERNFVAEPPL